MNLLTDDDIEDMWQRHCKHAWDKTLFSPQVFTRAVESEVLRRVREGVEPVAWGMPDENGHIYDCISPQEHAFIEGGYTIPLFATPPDAQARIAELEAALRECVDLAWIDDSHSVQFDGTVLFGLGYDFSGVDGPAREEFLAEYECIVWPSGGTGRSKWSAYCTYDGSLWFEKFDTSTEAKEACMQLLDKVLPQHPAMKARAALQPKEPTK
jgi:hypothetical protein